MISALRYSSTTLFDIEQEDEPVVEIRCETTAETVEVHISDDGQEIPDHQKQVIFEQREKGIGSSETGIGLGLVQTLVEQYDGSIRAEDSSATGSVFSVKLPEAE